MSRGGTPWWLPALSRLAALLMVGLSRTWRIRCTGDYLERDARMKAGERCIYAFWHARLLPLVITHRGRGVGVLISRHRDGEWIAQVLEALGYTTARGSSTRGGEAATLSMLGYAAEGRSLAISPDGPRGPARRVKPGLLYLAGRTGLPVVPIVSAGNPVWILRSWDRFRIPKPFARVQIAYGAPLQVPAELDEAGQLHWCGVIEAAIDELTLRAGEAVGEPA